MALWLTRPNNIKLNFILLCKKKKNKEKIVLKKQILFENNRHEHFSMENFNIFVWPKKRPTEAHSIKFQFESQIVSGGIFFLLLLSSSGAGKNFKAENFSTAFFFFENSFTTSLLSNVNQLTKLKIYSFFNPPNACVRINFPSPFSVSLSLSLAHFRFKRKLNSMNHLQYSFSLNCKTISRFSFVGHFSGQSNIMFCLIPTIWRFIKWRPINNHFNVDF